jgi:muramoyltetrapeptide carboxypeptidase
VKPTKLKKPHVLKRGDTIALIRPAGFISDKIFFTAAENLRALGFCVATYPGKWPKKSEAHPSFSATDEVRAAEMNWAFSQPGISAVLCCRGGYGSVRTANQISPEQLKKWRPKIFVGFSDITYLHQLLQNERKMVSFHGPLTGFLNKSHLKKFLQNIMALPSKPMIQKWSEVRSTGTKKSARGKLVGGNLSLLQTSGRAALPKEPIILAIEEVNEDFYRIDRMLWALIDAGYSEYIRGIVLGSFKNCGARDSKTFGWKKVQQTLRKLTKGPIWEGASFGHGLKTQRLLPLGCQVEMKNKSLRFLEAAVSESN